MIFATGTRSTPILFLLASVPLGAFAADTPAQPKAAEEQPGVSLLDAARAGDVAVDAEGTGDGRVTLKVTNHTNRRLKVVLPPGLVASGATGQFGGMGGGRGGRGGGMNGGMGGMNGGMSGMGGMGGGMGGMGGGMGMGGGGMLTMPPTMGMMMLGRLIMTLVEPTDSWDPTSLMQGMMMGMGGRGMGMGMGMGMGGMGMGGMGMGGRGGGFRSVPPTDLPNAILGPGQTRPLSTRVVSLNAPGGDGRVILPAEGEKLVLGDVGELYAPRRYQEALRRLARDKADEGVAQVALWGVAGMDWDSIAVVAKGWANGHELALARQLADRLDAGSLPEGEAGQLFVEVEAAESGPKGIAEALAGRLRDASALGLRVESRVPMRPDGPAVACKVRLSGTAEQPEATVQLASSSATGRAWGVASKFSLAVPRDASGRPDADRLADAVVEALARRLVTVAVVEGARVKGKRSVAIRVENRSPLVLNGIALAAKGAGADDSPRMLLGIALSPMRSMMVPASPEALEAAGIKEGFRVFALDLSAL